MNSEKSVAANALDFLMLMGKLKDIKRTMWTYFNIEVNDRVADHNLRMAFIAAFFDWPPEIDRNKLLELTIIHDIPKCTLGDITHFSGVSREEIRSSELAAVKEITTHLEYSAAHIEKLYTEYDKKKTREAILIHDLLEFDMILQAINYEKQFDFPGKLESVIRVSEKSVTDENILRLLAVVKKKRTDVITEKLISTKKV